MSRNAFAQCEREYNEQQESIEAAKWRAESCECDACCGEGRIPVGESGAYHQDGEKYDPPGWEMCEACNGEGRV